MGLSAFDPSGSLPGRSGSRCGGRIPQSQPMPAVCQSSGDFTFPSGSGTSPPPPVWPAVASGRHRSRLPSAPASQLPSSPAPPPPPAGRCRIVFRRRNPVGRRQQQRPPLPFQFLGLAGLHQRRRIERLRGGRRLLHQRQQRHIRRQPAPPAEAEISPQFRLAGRQQQRRR